MKPLKLILLLLAIAPGLALACPYCAAQDNSLNDAFGPITALLGAPFVAFTIVTGLVIRNARQTKEDQIDE